MKTCRGRYAVHGVTALLPLLLLTLVVGGCGSSANPCTGNVAIVAGNPVTQSQYRRLLDYTLNFYQYGDTSGPYYGRKICSRGGNSSACRAVKRDLQTRMIDQQIVEAYAKRHHLLPSLADWTIAKEQEQQLIHKLGGQAHFSKYLRELGVGEFQLIENLQIETRKTQRAIGSETQFKRWLVAREAAVKLTRCSLQRL